MLLSGKDLFNCRLLVELNKWSMIQTQKIKIFVNKLIFSYF